MAKLGSRPRQYGSRMSSFPTMPCYIWDSFFLLFPISLNQSVMSLFSHLNIGWASALCPELSRTEDKGLALMETMFSWGRETGNNLTFGLGNFK